MLAALANAAVPYTVARDDFCPGDVLLLHHAFAADWMNLSWYDKQICAVQRFTGPFAHIGIIDRIAQAGEERVVVYESVVPKVRCVRLSTTAKDIGGFFWLSLKRDISTEEREAIWTAMGTGPYSKWGAVLAGMDRLPADEDARDRMWCAKFFRLMRRLSGVQLNSSVPTEQAIALLNMGGSLRYVQMDSPS